MVRLHEESWRRDETRRSQSRRWDTTSHRVSQKLAEVTGNDQGSFFFVGVQKIVLDLELVLGWDKSSAKTPSAGLASGLVGRPKVQSDGVDLGGLRDHDHDHDCRETYRGMPGARQD